MFKPNQEKSDRSKEIVRLAFNQSYPDCSRLTLAYGYFAKKGLFGQTMLGYAVGFSAEEKLLVLIPLDSDGNSGEATVLRQGDIESCKMGLRGGAVIKSSLLDKKFQIVVPGFTPPSAEDMYLLPIVQEEEAVAFKDFINAL